MSFKEDIIKTLPYCISSQLRIPFSLKFGNDYTNFSRLIHQDLDIKSYALDNFSKIFNYAKSNLQFYKKIYKEAGVINLKIEKLSDIEKIPIITKYDLRNSLNDFSGKFSVNTGGSSGEPFSFYIDKNANAREWAHMHTIWKIKDYKTSDLKISFTGGDLGNKLYYYHPTHNEFKFNSYLNSGKFKKEILKLFDNYQIKYLHGYPSAILNFLYELEQVITPEEKNIIRKNMRSCFFGSEYPTPNITNYIKTNWQLDYISWYGHSEKCILAYDATNNNNYTPFYTYGFTEVFKTRLIGTSYHNYDMPLIRVCL